MPLSANADLNVQGGLLDEALLLVADAEREDPPDAMVARRGGGERHPSAQLARVLGFFRARDSLRRLLERIALAIELDRFASRVGAEAHRVLGVDVKTLPRLDACHEHRLSARAERAL